MLEFILEHPLMLALAGAAAVGLAVFIWLQTAHRAALQASIALGLLTIVLVVLSLQVETDREAIRRTLDEVADALERNDFEFVYSYMHPNAEAGVQRARGELPNYTFSEARVTRVKEIQVNHTTTPNTAIAEFNVFVKVGTQGQSFNVPRFVKIYFMKRGERWMVRDYEHFEPTAGFRNTPLTSPTN